MKIRINNLWEFDKIKDHLKNPKKGDSYVFYKAWELPNIGSSEYCKIIISKVKRKNLHYYKELKKFKIKINELENIIESGLSSFMEFYNYYDYQNYIEAEKSKQVSEQ